MALLLNGVRYPEEKKKTSEECIPTARNRAWGKKVGYWEMLAHRCMTV